MRILLDEEILTPEDLERQINGGAKTRGAKVHEKCSKSETFGAKSSQLHDFDRLHELLHDLKRHLKQRIVHDLKGPCQPEDRWVQGPRNRELSTAEHAKKTETNSIAVVEAPSISEEQGSSSTAEGPVITSSGTTVLPFRCPSRGTSNQFVPVVQKTMYGKLTKMEERLRELWKKSIFTSTEPIMKMLEQLLKTQDEQVEREKARDENERERDEKLAKIEETIANMKKRIEKLEKSTESADVKDKLTQLSTDVRILRKPWGNLTEEGEELEDEDESEKHQEQDDPAEDVPDDHKRASAIAIYMHTMGQSISEADIDLPDIHEPSEIEIAPPLQSTTENLTQQLRVEDDILEAVSGGGLTKLVGSSKLY
nr:uncharacterized protein LOC108948831 [Nicotiana tomentosiformis]